MSALGNAAEFVVDVGLTGVPGPGLSVRETREPGGNGEARQARRGNDSVEVSTQARVALAAETASAEEGEGGKPADASAPRGTDGEPLSEGEQEQVEELQARDREVRTHEQAHKSAAGQYATSGPTYTYQTGPDGKRYAVGGSVGIDLSPEDTPEATIQKMAVVRRAALAPAEPSSQDRKVAAEATRIAQQARQEQQAERRDEQSGETEQAQTISSRPSVNEAGVSDFAGQAFGDAPPPTSPRLDQFA